MKEPIEVLRETFKKQGSDLPSLIFDDEITDAIILAMKEYSVQSKDVETIDALRNEIDSVMSCFELVNDCSITTLKVEKARYSNRNINIVIDDTV